MRHMILITHEILESEIIMTKYIKDHLKDNIEVQSIIVIWTRFQYSRQTCFEIIVVKHYIRDIILSCIDITNRKTNSELSSLMLTV